MYLTKKTYIGNHHKKAEEQVKIEIPGIKQERVIEIIERVAYWRKANSIHNWFVLNVQDGEDDCKEYCVEEDELRDLLDTINEVLASIELIEGEVTTGQKLEEGEWVDITEKGKVIKDPTTAKRLLPSQAGFFFGGTDYDEYYYKDLVQTKKILEAVVEEGGEYYYQASW